MGKRNRRNKSVKQVKTGETSIKEEGAPNKTRNLYEDIVRENPNFVQYYKDQKICTDDEDFENMIKALKSDLPSSFRISSWPKDKSNALLKIVESEFFTKLTDSTDKEKEKCLPQCLPWYPDRYGWQINMSRNFIRKSEDHYRLHNFLIQESACGTISRQEVVSMIPPLFLDVKENHKILDMCAAPGSKTAQLIELLHSNSNTIIPSGVVVANDINNKRCYMLVHQAKRLSSPCLIVTNHDSCIMPNFYVQQPNEEKPSILKFDRILCDVPCSGDGTMRKNPDIWQKWNPVNGHNLHGIQIRVLKRGLEMLAVGGRLVYSTCSLNPIENEAVIHRMLTMTEGAVELVDASDQLAGLKYTKGLSHWLPASKDGITYKSFEEVPEHMRTVIRPQMFPPAEPEKFNLHRCIRILPHQQDTGGFFVAVLIKTSLLPWESYSNIQGSATSGDERPIVTQDKKLSQSNREKKIKLGFKEDPFVFFGDNDPVWNSIRDFYAIEENDIIPSCLFTRCHVGKKKIIYLASPIVKNILNHNPDIKIINSGIKVFARFSNNPEDDCSFRLVNEALPCIVSFVGDARKINVNKEELCKILYCSDLKSGKMCLIEECSQSARESFEKIDIGSCVLDCDCPEMRLALVGWRGKSAIRAYLSVPEIVHYLRIFGQDVSQYTKNKFEKANEEAIENGNEEAIENGNEEAIENGNKEAIKNGNEEAIENGNEETIKNGNEEVIENGNCDKKNTIMKKEEENHESKKEEDDPNISNGSSDASPKKLKLA